MGSSDPAMYLVLVVLLALSAFFSASETAISSVNKIRLKNYADNGMQKAKVALEVAEDYDKTLSTILIGNNIVNIASSSIATMLATAAFGAKGAVLATFVITVLVLIFGEVLPKSYAKDNSESLALKVSGYMKFLTTVMSPVVFLFVKLKEAMAKMTNSEEKAPSVTEQELMYIIETIEGEGVLNQRESELVQSALEFEDITVQEIITHRVDMGAIDITDTPDEIEQTILNERFSRMPVYEKNLDQIVGILATRDYLEAKLRGEEPDLKKLMFEPYYVHKTMKIGTLLSEFKKNKLHIAIVTDDYGGTMGIVTMEDMLEELVGEIWDEDEDEMQELVQVDSNSYEVNGDMNLYDLMEELDIDTKEIDTDYNSISGWTSDMLGHLPTVGESFCYQSLTITILEMDDQRILKVGVVKHSDDQEQDIP